MALACILPNTHQETLLTFKSTDRDYVVTAAIEENAFMFNVRSTIANSFVGVELTKGLARELRDWLNQALPAHED